METKAIVTWLYCCCDYKLTTSSHGMADGERWDGQCPRRDMVKNGHIHSRSLLQRTVVQQLLYVWHHREIDKNRDQRRIDTEVWSMYVCTRGGLPTVLSMNGV